MEKNKQKGREEMEEKVKKKKIVEGINFALRPDLAAAKESIRYERKITDGRSVVSLIRTSSGFRRVKEEFRDDVVIEDVLLWSDYNFLRNTSWDSRQFSLDPDQLSEAFRGRLPEGWKELKHE